MATISSGSPVDALTASGAGQQPPMQNAPSGGGSIHPLVSLRKHRRLALMLAVFIVVVGLPVAWILGTPKYTATAVIYVSPRFLSNLTDSSTQKFDSIGQYQQYVQQNVKTINRFDIVLDSLKKNGDLQSFWVKKGETLERAASR